MHSIEELESRLEEGLIKLRSPEFQSLETYLKPLLPKGYRAHVSLVDKTGRKKRRTASADNWSPEDGGVSISFVPDTQSFTEDQEKPIQTKRRSAEVETPVPDPVADLVRALNRSEARPGYNFIALKWFRDVVLPAEGFAWAQSDSVRQSVLRDAIEKRLVLTSKVPNPKSPQFPVTAIRLNRLLPATQAMLGAAAIPDSEFDPVDIRGESLSATVLRERR